MGEQLPLDTLCGFINTALAPNEHGRRRFYSRPESVTGSFESRRFLAPRSSLNGVEQHAQTDFFEYHWADKMQGNRLDDLWPTFRRILLQPPWRVPAGLRVVWVAAWLAIAAAAWACIWGPWRSVFSGDGDLVTRLVSAVVTGGVTAAIVSYLIARVLPRWLTSSFVDVVRYLDTSPRSYAVRREIRKGLVEMLQALHASKAPRYDRIVLVAHSLGAYLAYDAVAYLWGLTNAQTVHDGKDVPILPGLKEVEETASLLPAPEDWQSPAVQNHVDRYQAAQRELWKGVRAQGNSWLITDFVSVGTPMYFADQLLNGKRGRSFGARIARRELPTCPPHNEESPDNNINGTRCYYSWEKTTWETPNGGRRRRVSRRVLYEGAPFAVVRWTNVYFPAEAGFFGDWFGGPLARLFGPGIRDVKVRGNTIGEPGTTWLRHRRMPGIAHSYYFQFPDDSSPESVTTFIRDGMDLAATEWLQESPGPTQAPDVGPAPFPAPPPPIGVAGGDDAVPDTPRLTVGDTTMEPVDEDDSGRRSTTGSGPGSP
jgi:hypothetical protein